MSDTPTDNWTGAPTPDGPVPAPPRQPSVLRRRVAGIAAVTGLSLGGLVGGYVISHAATTVATATPSPSGSSSTAPGYGMHDGGIARGAIPGGRDEDLQIVASTIGISTGDLQSALQNGQTIAAVAKAHNVDVNTVISALVASETKEIDTALSNGSITSAQATQLKANVQQRVTDMVNGTRPSGCPGFGDHGFRGPAAPPGGNSTNAFPGGFAGGGSA